ncbi:MAG: hypothetical protein L7F77_02805 [Candidatus Magnetominusculus sp. LBB02]|nr:hypothetical protein [Candidatus Magnetominusculus sp. LBB02]
MTEETVGALSAKMPDDVAADRYSLLINTITAMETRLIWSELAYMFFTGCILMFSVGLLSFAGKSKVVNMLVMFLAVTGEFTCVHWLITSMKHQMKLKLRYFQARYLERQQGLCGGQFLSDEMHYFNPSIGYVESPDKVERVTYPSSGATSMDGFAGSAKPRHLTWFMASMMFIVYIALLLWVAADMVKAS